jgi:hypothetical protein
MVANKQLEGCPVTAVLDFPFPFFTFELSQQLGRNFKENTEEKVKSEKQP